MKMTRLWRLFDLVAWKLLLGSISAALIMCPPQVGKSQYWSRFFPTWWIGANPSHRVVLGSHGAQYAASWGRQVRDTLGRFGPAYFGVHLRDDLAAANEWGLAAPNTGGMVTAGIEGGVAGRSAEVVIADDIIADAATAESRLVKDRVWGWYEEELCSRLQHGGIRVMVMTRRAVDDPPGRIADLIQAGKEKGWAVLKLPAIAEETEHWPDWGWHREVGEALVPELHDAAEYEQIRLRLDPHVWAGLYQQRPYPRGGGDLRSEWFKIVDADQAAIASVRAWDLAGSESPTAKRTAGVLMTKRRDGTANRYHIPDVRYGRWNPGRRNEIIRQVAEHDGRGIPIVIEQEGGSGGKAQVEELKRLLDGWTVREASATGSKELRAGPLAGQASVGNLTIRKAAWNSEFHAEVDSFPGGPTIDMVDAAAHAYNYLAGEQPARVAAVSAPSISRVFPSSSGRMF
jgi:predicted phage terminase large subunit-like protein